jgi:hypothetical protein
LDLRKKTKAMKADALATFKGEIVSTLTYEWEFADKNDIETKVEHSVMISAMPPALKTPVARKIFLFVLSLLLLHTAAAEEGRLAGTPNPDERIPADFIKVYETSFEGLKVKDENRLTWEFPHWCEFAAMHREDGGQGNGEGGARLWVEDGRARSGKGSVGLELFDIEKSRRADFVILPEKYLSSAYFISYWAFLPEDWGLFQEEIAWDWYEIGNPYSTSRGPYSAIYIKHPDKEQKTYTVALGGRDAKGKGFTAAEKQLVIPKGRWFEIAYQVHRHPTNGSVKLWFDGHLIGERTGFSTMHPTKSKFTVGIGKVYHDRGDKTPHRLWIDDLQIFTAKH